MSRIRDFHQDYLGSWVYEPHTPWSDWIQHNGSTNCPVPLHWLVKIVESRGEIYHNHGIKAELETWGDILMYQYRKPLSECDVSDELKQIGFK